MNPGRLRFRATLFGTAIGAALLMAGCSEELGPIPMRVARVRGIVHLEQDRPVAGGWIEFIPTDGTIGNLRSAPLRPDGRFDADGVALGTNTIRLVNARLESFPLGRRFSSFNSPIRREITTDSSVPLSINLLEEAIRYQRDQSGARSGPRTPPGGSP